MCHDETNKIKVYKYLYFRTSDEKKEKKVKKGRSTKQQVIKDVDDGDDEGGWEEVTGKGGAPLVVVSLLSINTGSVYSWVMFLIGVVKGYFIHIKIMYIISLKCSNGLTAVLLLYQLICYCAKVNIRAVSGLKSICASYGTWVSPYASFLHL